MSGKSSVGKPTETLGKLKPLTLESWRNLCFFPLSIKVKVSNDPDVPVHSFLEWSVSRLVSPARK